MKRLAVILLAVLCIGSTPPMPPKPKPAVSVRSPRGSSVQVNAPMAAVIPLRAIELTWTNGRELPNRWDEFDIEVSDDQKNWKLLATVDAPPFSFVPTGNQAFIRLGSHPKSQL